MPVIDRTKAGEEARRRTHPHAAPPSYGSLRELWLSLANSARSVRREEEFVDAVGLDWLRGSTRQRREIERWVKEKDQPAIDRAWRTQFRHVSWGECDLGTLPRRWRATYLNDCRVRLAEANVFDSFCLFYKIDRRIKQHAQSAFV